MKKALALVLCFFIAGFSFAFETHTKGIGGNFSFGLKENISGLTIFPKASYFFKDNICLDISFGYEISWKEYPYPSDPENYYIGLGSRYFLKNFYGGLGFLYHAFNNKAMESKSHDINLELSAGYLIGFSRNVFLDIGVVYLKGIGDEKRQSLAYEYSFGTSKISLKNNTSKFRSNIGVLVFFK